MSTLLDRHTHILSATPSRTRIRLSAKRRTPEEIDRLTRGLQARPEVYSVRPNSLTGSMVIHHSTVPDILTILTATLRDLGVILFQVFAPDALPLAGKSAAADSIFTAVDDLDRQIGQLTDNLVDLRFLFPLGLGGLAIHQLLKNGWQLETAPWYVLAYYAFDSFLKLNQPSTANNPSSSPDSPS